MSRPRADGVDPGAPAAAGRRDTVIQNEFMEDLKHRVPTDRKVALRALDLMKATRRDLFGGIGKPEPLKLLGSDIWSHRITAQGRLVYRVDGNFVDLLQARYHY